MDKGEHFNHRDKRKRQGQAAICARLASKKSLHHFGKGGALLGKRNVFLLDDCCCMQAFAYEP